VRVIAGDYEGAKGTALTFSPMNVWDLHLCAGRRVAFTLPEGWTTLLVVLRGQVAVGDTTMVIGQTAHFTRTRETIAIAAKKDSLALLLNGKPLDEPIAHYGPFVMNTEKELSEAIDDFRSGRFGKLEHGY